MTLKQNRWILFVVAAVMLACVSPIAPAAQPIPTFDPNSLVTAVVETANAAGTQTAAFLPPTFTPSVTPFPSATPSITPTATETFVFLLFTSTPAISKATSASGNTPKPYACELVSQSPEDNTPIGAGADFDIRWQVKNTGSKFWSADSFDFRYESGDALHQESVYDLYKDVSPGGTIDLIVDMKAPGEPGTYKTFWKIYAGKAGFCQLSLTISVK